MTDTMLVLRDARDEESASSAGGAAEPAAFTNVLVGVDGTSTGRDAIALGEMLRHRNGRLTLAHVVFAEAPSYRNFHSTPRWKRVRKMLEREREAAGVSADLTGMFAPSVGSGLHQLVEDRAADLLVIGSCQRGFFDRLFRGDDTRGSLSRASCTVAVAPDGYATRSQRIDTIGVAYNGTPESDSALAAAQSLAVRDRAAIRAMTAVWPTGLSVVAGIGLTTL